MVDLSVEIASCGRPVDDESRKTTFAERNSDFYTLELQRDGAVPRMQLWLGGHIALLASLRHGSFVDTASPCTVYCAAPTARWSRLRRCSFRV